MITGTVFVGCKPPTVGDRVYSCALSQKYQMCTCGDRILDYKQDRAIVGEWADVSLLQEFPIEECPDLVGFSLEDWLIKIKPKLKEGHDYWIDYRGSK